VKIDNLIITRFRLLIALKVNHTIWDKTIDTKTEATLVCKVRSLNSEMYDLGKHLYDQSPQLSAPN